jgi:arginine exporter protein ArgO
MIRSVTAGFVVLFALVVAMGYVPAFVTAVHGEERTLFDLFKISLLDDVTHAGTAVAAAVAVAHSRRACLLFLTAFGFYYALDAIFFLIYGVLSHQAPMANLMLNAPHVAIATVMLGLVYWWAPREERAAMAPERR